jgi:hypothetical protein
MANILTAEYFEPHIGKSCRLGDGAVPLDLVQIERFEHQRANGAARTPFFLILRGPAGNVLPEGFYSVEIGDGPALELYVIPTMTPVRDHQNYQIVFN